MTAIPWCRATRDQTRSPGRTCSGPSRPRRRASDAGVTTYRPSHSLDDLRVPATIATPAARAACPSRLRRRSATRSPLDHEPGREPERAGADHGEIVDGAVDRELPMSPPGNVMGDDVASVVNAEPAAAWDDGRVGKRRDCSLPSSSKEAREVACRRRPRRARVTISSRRTRRPCGYAPTALLRPPHVRTRRTHRLLARHHRPERHLRRARRQTLHSTAIFPVSTSPHWQASGPRPAARQREPRLRVPLGERSRRELRCAAASRRATRGVAQLHRLAIAASAGCPVRGDPAYWSLDLAAAREAQEHATDCSRSTGSNAETTTGRPNSPGMKRYASVPITADVPRSTNASIASPGETEDRLQRRLIVWLQKTEKFRMPSARARRASLPSGAVVSKPTAKKTTCAGSFGRARASSGE